MSCPYPHDYNRDHGHDPRAQKPTRDRNPHPITNDIPFNLLELLTILTCQFPNGFGPLLHKPISKVVDETNQKMNDYIILWQDYDIEFTGACLDRMIPILMRMHESLMKESRKRRAKAKLLGV